MDVAVEGRLDELVVRRILSSQGKSAHTVYIKYGKAKLLAKLDGYNAAARHRRFFVLVDLDLDHDCAPEFLAERLPSPAPKMVCRVAVRSVEAWLLADRERIASFLSVASSQITSDPDGLPNAKRYLTQAARQSRKRVIRDGVPPRQRSGRAEGRIYTSLLGEFVSDETNGWRPEVAVNNSKSLRRALTALARMS